LIFVLAAAAPASLATAGVAPLFHVDQHDFESQPLVGKDARKVNQLIEDVQERAALRAAAAPELDSAAAVELYQQLVGNDWLDDANAVVGQQKAYLITNRGQRTVLNLDQLLTANRVDAESAARDFLETVVACVQGLQLFVEGRLHPMLRRPVSPRLLRKSNDTLKVDQPIACVFATIPRGE
jgi:hypothetical protein